MSEQQLRLQVEELQALAATYPEEGALSYTLAEQAALALLTSLTEAAMGSVQAAAAGLSQLSGTLKLLDTTVGGQPAALRFTLPADYPPAAPRLQVECSCDREHHNELTAAVEQVCRDSAADGCCLLLAADALQQRVADMLESGAVQSEAAVPRRATAEGRDPVAAPAVLSRTVIWFHHIKSFTKRKHIVQWADELHLGGYSKPGFPGVIVCEGLTADVDEYVQRLRALKWQAMAVRGSEEEVVSELNGVAAARCFPGSRFQELPETGMSDLAAACRGAGMEDLFLAALKIVKT